MFSQYVRGMVYLLCLRSGPAFQQAYQSQSTLKMRMTSTDKEDYKQVIPYS